MVRHKNRYMAVEINERDKDKHSSLRLRPAALHDAIHEMVQQLHGDFGVAAIRAGFAAKYCNEKTRIAVIRARHGPHKLVASALPCIRKIDNKIATVCTLYVGATIRHCFKFLKVYQQKKFDEFCVSLKTDEEKLAMKDAMLDLESVLQMR